ncbi:DNA mismatch repair protein MutS [bacterium]|nr:DNA mismatch repair protein MutS [bacterium]
MGSRTLKKWLVRPLLSKNMINHRLQVVDFLKNNYRLLAELRELLKTVGDSERVIGRIALHRGKLSDYQNLQSLLVAIPLIKQLFLSTHAPALLENILTALGDFSLLKDLLDRALYQGDEHDWIINGAFNEQLDQLRLLVHNTQNSLMALEQQEQRATGINSLKIRYTSVSGYYIEITNTHAHLVPSHYKRHQTLVGRERFTCQALQELQQEIISAQSQIVEHEQALFEQLKNTVVGYIPALRKATHALCQLDALGSFSRVAAHNNYTKPVFHEDDAVRDIIIKQGKHPVVAQSVGHAFVANDLLLNDEQKCLIITGPNMGGKSTFLRQTALIQIMAQCGSFVPAHSAQLYIVDKIFTRIGASDNVSQGKSTFLVEMEETAHICQYATEKSLVILDEVGRGTSTFDGIAIAQSVIEYLIVQSKVSCLFATHYHELTELTHDMPTIKNYHAASVQEEGNLVFLHKIVPGIAQASFGLEVAKLAHMPDVVVKRAQEILKKLLIS